MKVLQNMKVKDIIMTMAYQTVLKRSALIL